MTRERQVDEPMGGSTPREVERHFTAPAVRMEKRPLTSPEQVEDQAKRRQLAAADPVAEAVATGSNTAIPVDPLTEAPLEGVLGHATYHTKSIMEAVRSKTSKLNTEEIASIGANTERLTAIVGLLVARLAATESKLEEAQRGAPVSAGFVPPPQEVP